MDYYKKPNRVEHWKRFFVVGALMLTALWILYGALVDTAGVPAPQWMKTRYSHGPVAKVHQVDPGPGESDCEACHVNFAPFSTSFGPKVKKCQHCHMDPKSEPHSLLQLNDSTPNCGACHRDHRGIDVDLKVMSDQFCTDCHNNLNDHMKGTTQLKATITSFTKDHPDFTPFKTNKDPGSVKFNHKYHMTPGVVFAQGGVPMTIGDLPDEYRERYRNLQPEGQRSNDSAIQLDCAACHQTVDQPLIQKSSEYRRLAASGDVQPLMTPKSYMKSIKYEQDCAACHPLNVDPALGRKIPHGKEPEELQSIVRKMYQTVAKNNPEQLRSRMKPLRPLPGKRPEASKELPLDQLLDQKVKSALSSLIESRRGCAECHFDASGSELSQNSKKVLRMEDDQKLIPDIWMKHAQFSHGSHEFMDCTSCHEGAMAKNEEAFTSEVEADSRLSRKGAEHLMMPGIGNCLNCHSESAPDGDVAFPRRQADHRCTECHLYHRGGPPDKGAAQHPHFKGLRQALNLKKPDNLLAEFFKTK